MPFGACAPTGRPAVLDDRWFADPGLRPRLLGAWPLGPARSMRDRLPAVGGSNVVLCRNFETAGCFMKDVPFPVSMQSHLSFTISGMIAGLSHDCSEASRTFAGEWTRSSTSMVPGTSISALEHANVITDAEHMELSWRSATCADRRIDSTCDASEHLIAPRQNHVLALSDKP